MQDRRPSSPAVDGAESPPTATPGPRSQFDLTAFRKYLGQLLPLVIEADPADLESLFERSDFSERATRWANDLNAGALYVVKQREERDVDEQRGTYSAVQVPRRADARRPCADDSLPDTFTYSLSSSLSYSPLQSATLALIKHVPILDSTVPLASQLHFLNLFGPASSSSGSNALVAGASAGSVVYEGLHRLVHYGVAPAFEAYVESKARKDAAGRAVEDSKDADVKMGIPMTKKKFAELELSLLHRTFAFALHCSRRG
jgi:dynein heavy chain 1